MGKKGREKGPPLGLGCIIGMHGWPSAVHETWDEAHDTSCSPNKAPSLLDMI